MLGKFQRKVTRSIKGEVSPAPHWRQGYTFYGFYHYPDEYVEEVDKGCGRTIRQHKVSSLICLQSLR